VRRNDSLRNKFSHGTTKKRIGEHNTTIYNDMKKKAIELGQKIVDIERIANEEFVNKSITDTQIKQTNLEKCRNLRTSSVYSFKHSFENARYSYL
jgi:hypothetical protein